MYHNLRGDLLSSLKERFLQEPEILETDFLKCVGNEGIKKEYCLKKYQHNLIYEPWERHALELDIDKEPEEVSYIASRKALTFNLFGNGNITIKYNPFGFIAGKYTIKYMSKLPVIKGKNTTIRFDVILNNRQAREIVIGRVKFLEWITLNNDSIKEHYLKSSYYFSEDAGRVFPQVIKKLLSVCSGDGMAYAGKYANFDALHVIKEIIAAYNLLEENIENLDINRIIVAEIYWKPVFYESLDQYAGRVFVNEKNSIKEANEMMKAIESVISLFKEKFDVSLEVKCLDFWSMLSVQWKTQEELEWMKRYII